MAVNELRDVAVDDVVYCEEWGTFLVRSSESGWGWRESGDDRAEHPGDRHLAGLGLVDRAEGRPHPDAAAAPRPDAALGRPALLRPRRPRAHRAGPPAGRRRGGAAVHGARRRGRAQLAAAP